VQYYKLITDDKNHADRWFLNDPRDAEDNEIDARLFTYGEPYTGPDPVTVPIDYLSYEVGFHLAAFDMPVVDRELARELYYLAPDGIELFDIEVWSLAVGQYSILNVIDVVDCVDRERSRIQYWPEDERPENCGEFRALGDIHIHPEKAEGHHIFRLGGWEIALIVSEIAKERIESFPNHGVAFRPVT